LHIEHCALTAALAVACIACGKKGPPLPPIVHIPAAVEQLEARRRGNDVWLTVTVPSKNIDGSVPVDIGRIEVYGYTGTAAPSKARFLEVATLVGTITIPEPKADAPPDVPPPPGTPVAGGTVTLVETLTPEALVAGPMPPPVVTRTGRAPSPAPIAPATESGPLRRFYYGLAFSPRGRLGPPGGIAELRVTELPETPRGVTATTLVDSVRLEWEPSGGIIGFLLERSLAAELSPLETPLPESPASAAPAPLTGPTRYNVYREIAPIGPAELASQQPQVGGGTSTSTPSVGPILITGVPLEALTFADSLTALDGRRRCYVVRSVRGDGAHAVEGLPSEPACVVAADDVAPEPPGGLSAAIEDGVVTVTWTPNAEPDVAGYLVLRGAPGDATLTPVTDTVVTEPRFTDRTVTPGVRYVYAVQAIDTRLPRPNVSLESARVEATAR
jgi:hypothetical protein